MARNVGVDRLAARCRPDRRGVDGPCPDPGQHTTGHEPASDEVERTRQGCDRHRRRDEVVVAQQHGMERGAQQDPGHAASQDHQGPGARVGYLRGPDDPGAREQSGQDVQHGGERWQAQSPRHRRQIRRRGSGDEDPEQHRGPRRSRLRQGPEDQDPQRDLGLEPEESQRDCPPGSQRQGHEEPEGQPDREIGEHRYRCHQDALESS